MLLIAYPQPPPPAASPGPGKRGNARGPLGGATPQQAASYNNDPRASPQMPRPTPPLTQAAQAPNVGNRLSELDLERMPENLKREGEDWFAIFNPQIIRKLDVDLVHTLPHQSVVCCVRFSLDGRYVATGCNHAAQIFDVITGEKVSHLQEAGTDEKQDLYIRSVCFSPDGRYLATGAEDKLIRVSSPLPAFIFFLGGWGM